MTLVTDLAAFTLAASLLTVTPGLDTALVLRSLSAGGPPAAFRAAVGVALGCLAWGLIVAAGLGALLAASRLGYDALRLCGAAYLLYLGLRLFLAPRREGLALTPQATAGQRAMTPVLRGFLTNILNPKVGVFYVSFLPQFVPPHLPVAPMIVALAAIHGTLGFGWFALLITAAAPLTAALRRPRTVALMDRLTGLVFLGFGLRLALGERG